jgi:6-phosphogluconolactonase
VEAEAAITAPEVAAAGGGNANGTPPSNNSPTSPRTVNTPTPSSSNVEGFAYVLNNQSANISAYSIDATTGALSEIPGSPFASLGALPEAMSITPSGEFAYVANYGSKNISGYSINGTTGVLTSVGAAVDVIGRPLSIAAHPSGRAIYVVMHEEPSHPMLDVSRSWITGFAIDTASGELTSIGSVSFQSYSGHITVDPSGRFVYVTNAGASQILAYSVDQTTGELSETAESPFGTTRNPEDITVAPSGKFAYMGGSFGTFGYNVDAETGALSEIAGSPFAPTSAIFHPAGRFAFEYEYDANYTPHLFTLTIDPDTGVLTKVGETAGLGLMQAFSPSGKFAFVPHSLEDTVSVYGIDTDTGHVTDKGGAVPTGRDPQTITTTPVRP